LSDDTNTNNNTEETNNNVTSTEDQPLEKDQISKDISDAKEQEMTYVLEISQTDEKRSKYLAKKNEYKIIYDDGKEETVTRKPLSSRKNKEIDDLRIAYFNNRTSNDKIMALGKEYDTANDILYEAFKRTAMYCLGLTAAQYDMAIWEDHPDYMKRDIFGLRSILAACLLRAVHGVAYFLPPSKNG